jgi:hypothetical protein
MTKYVILVDANGTPDAASGTKVLTVFAEPQAITNDKPGYAEIADNDARYLAWQALQAAVAAAEALIAGGVQIVCTSKPALNGTYSVDPASKTNIDGIYAGIKGGDGLPGGGATFNYPDVTGAMHAFDATTFPGFAKAVRDFAYQVAQGETPSQPVTIP